MNANNQNLVCFAAASAIALDAMKFRLRELSEMRIEEPDGADIDVHADHAMVVALEKITQMQKTHYPDWFAMMSDWWGVAGVVECAAAVFSRPDSHYGRILKSLPHYFDVLADVMDLARPDDAPKLEPEIAKQQAKIKPRAKAKEVLA